MAVKSFAFYSEYYELITLLNEEEQKELSLAILNYMFDDKKPNLNANQMKIKTKTHQMLMLLLM